MKRTTPPGILRSLLLMLTAAAITAGCSACSSVSEVAHIEKQAIIAAVGIDKGDEKRFDVSAQVFQSMGAGASTPIDSSQTNTVVVSAQGDTIGECMSSLSAALGRKINTGHNKFIVIGRDALDIPLSESLDYFIRSEQTYLGVPVICSLTTARDVIDIKLKNEVETALAIENIIKNAIDSGAALKSDLLTISNSTAAALPAVSVKKPPESNDGKEEEEAKLIFEGTAVVSGGKTVYSADPEKTMGFSILEGSPKGFRISLSDGDEALDVFVTLSKRRASIRLTEDGFSMIYRLRCRIKLLNGFDGPDEKELCGAAERELEKLCTESFASLKEHPEADFLGIDKIAKSVYPFQTENLSGIIAGCGIQVYAECSLDR